MNPAVKPPARQLNKAEGRFQYKDIILMAKRKTAVTPVL